MEPKPLLKIVRPRRGISLLILDRKIAVYWSSRATGPTVLVWILICFGNALKR
jgi:hypothetical protein